MRLGDLDALYDCVEARYRSSSGEEHKAERALLDAICEMPTIPAISVEWLEDKELDYRTTGDKMFSDAFAVVIGEWQKEQEAR